MKTLMCRESFDPTKIRNNPLTAKPDREYLSHLSPSSAFHYFFIGFVPRRPRRGVGCSQKGNSSKTKREPTLTANPRPLLLPTLTASRSHLLIV